MSSIVVYKSLYNQSIVPDVTQSCSRITLLVVCASPDICR